jgi:GNAT superfamily N-acetyltransferase
VHRLTDAYIADYAAAAFDDDRVIVGYFDGMVLRGVGEMRLHCPDGKNMDGKNRDGMNRDGKNRDGMNRDGMSGARPHTADVSLSVERAWRGRKIGEELMGALILEARHLGIKRIAVACLRDNLPMQRIVTRFAGDLRRENGTVLGIIERHKDLLDAA